MKTLYLNINNEQIQSNDELEVLNYDLDGDFFFCLGEKIAKGCKVKNENALITDFNTQDNEEDYQQIIAQWNKLKSILFSEECKGEFDITLPKGYIHWMRFHSQYVTIYDRNFSHGESGVISIDLEELYEESVEILQRRILRKLEHNNLYLDIDEIVFNDDAITPKSPIVRVIKEMYESVGFKACEKWLQDNCEKEDSEEGIPDIGIPIENGEDNCKDDLTYLVNWLCDEFEKERSGDLRNYIDETKLKKIVSSAIFDCKNSRDNSAHIDMVCQKYDINGNCIHKTRFKRQISNDLLYALTHIEEIENVNWGWEYVRTLNNGMKIKKYNNKYGLVDRYDIVILKCEYDEIMPLKFGNIRIKKNGNYGVLNQKKIVISCKYDDLIELGEIDFKVRMGGREWHQINWDGLLKQNNLT